MVIGQRLRLTAVPITLERPEPARYDRRVRLTPVRQACLQDRRAESLVIASFVRGLFGA